jgi:hypothetical protein
MAAPIVGGHPVYDKPQGACGAFSFKGNDRDLFFFWAIPGGQMMAAWTRSSAVNTAVVTFHPADTLIINDTTHYRVFTHMIYAAVPPPNMFRIECAGQILQANNGFAYHLFHGPITMFYILDQAWEKWEPQHQMWRQAMSGNVSDHNV